jgi:hypothetical protein
MIIINTELKFMSLKNLDTLPRRSSDWNLFYYVFAVPYASKVRAILMVYSMQFGGHMAGGGS